MFIMCSTIHSIYFSLPEADKGINFAQLLALGGTLGKDLDVPSGTVK